MDGTKSKSVFLSQKNGVEKTDPNTPRRPAQPCRGGCCLRIAACGVPACDGGVGAGAGKDRCTTRVYTTPSIRYAMLKLAALTRNAGYVPFQGKRISIVRAAPRNQRVSTLTLAVSPHSSRHAVRLASAHLASSAYLLTERVARGLQVLQCKQMGGGVSVGGFQKCGDTIGWRLNEPPRGQRISPVVPVRPPALLRASYAIPGTLLGSDAAHVGQNHEIEWYTMRRSSVLPYRVLLKVDAQPPCNRLAAAMPRLLPPHAHFPSNPTNSV